MITVWFNSWVVPLVIFRERSREIIFKKIAFDIRQKRKGKDKITTVVRDTVPKVNLSRRNTSIEIAWNKKLEVDNLALGRVPAGCSDS